MSYIITLEFKTAAVGLAGRDDFIEVTEWVNGEGVDVDLHSKHSGDTKFSLTYGEWDCLQMIMEYE